MEPYHTCCSRTQYVLNSFCFRVKRDPGTFNGSIVFRSANNLHVFNLLPIDSISEMPQFLLQWYHIAQTPWPHRRSPDTWVVKGEEKWRYDRSGIAERCVLGSWYIKCLRYRFRTTSKVSLIWSHPASTSLKTGAGEAESQPSPTFKMRVLKVSKWSQSSDPIQGKRGE